MDSSAIEEEEEGGGGRGGGMLLRPANLRCRNKVINKSAKKETLMTFERMILRKILGTGDRRYSIENKKEF